jgi:hypothetical protein
MLAAVSSKRLDGLRANGDVRPFPGQLFRYGAAQPFAGCLDNRHASHDALIHSANPLKNPIFSRIAAAHQLLPIPGRRPFGGV